MGRSSATILGFERELLQNMDFGDEIEYSICFIMRGKRLWTARIKTNRQLFLRISKALEDSSVVVTVKAEDIGIE